MFERFTDRARATVVLAQEEARLLRHDYIGTEHILLGLVREGEGLAARALQALGISLESVRERVTGFVGEGEHSPKGHIPFTPRAKKVLELSLREAMSLKHNYIGTEHILLGLVREGDGVAAQVLVGLGAGLDRVRQEVRHQLAGQALPAAEFPALTQQLTPAAQQAVAAAERLAGGSPMGSHHLLEALVRSEDSAAARVLAAIGVDPDTLAAAIDEAGIEGTSDLTDEEAAARQIEIRADEDKVTITLRDETSVALGRAVTTQLGGPVRGDDPVTGGLLNLYQAVIGSLAALQTRLSPTPTGEPESDTTVRLSALIQRALASRLRRRGA